MKYFYNFLTFLAFATFIVFINVYVYLFFFQFICFFYTNYIFLSYNNTLLYLFILILFVSLLFFCWAIFSFSILSYYYPTMKLTMKHFYRFLIFVVICIISLLSEYFTERIYIQVFCVFYHNYNNFLQFCESKGTLNVFIIVAIASGVSALISWFFTKYEKQSKYFIFFVLFFIISGSNKYISTSIYIPFLLFIYSSWINFCNVISYMTLVNLLGYLLFEVSILFFCIIFFSILIYYFFCKNNNKYLFSETTIFFGLLAVIFCLLIGIFYCENFLLLFILLETLFFCLLYFVVIRKNRVLSYEAGIKYLILNIFSNISFLIFLYILCFHIKDFSYLSFKCYLFIEIIGSYINVADDLIINAFLYSDVLVLIRYIYMKFIVFLAIFSFFIIFFFKLGVAPFHFWMLDVYESLSYGALYFYGVFIKLAFCILFLYLYITCFSFLFSIEIQNNFFSSFIKYLFLSVSYCSLFVGTIGSLFQRRIKRLIIYSSITNMGFFFMCLSTLTLEGCLIALFLLVGYFFIMTLIFWVLICYRNLILGDLIYLHQLKALNFYAISNVKSGGFFFCFALSIGFISLSGLPFFIGFIAKFYLFQLLMFYKFYSLIIFSIICSIVNFFVYLNFIRLSFFDSFDEVNDATIKNITLASFSHFDFFFVVLLLFIITFFFFIF